MKNTSSINVCIRCGKTRIVARQWKEKVFGSVIINTETVCPDPQCQKELVKDLKSQNDKRKAQQKIRDERKAMHKKTAAAA